MENKYTLTIYVAAPGTPTIKDGKKDTSTVGHVYYSISDGHTKIGWGFAPTFSSPVWKGEVVNNEFNIYKNPVFERTMEITKKQYNSLKDFGLHPGKHGFNSSIYNAFSNSCVDFLYNALKEGGIYHRQVYGNDIIGLVDYEGAVRVPRNIEELTNIPNPIPDSTLNKVIRRSLPEQNWGQRNILSKNDDISPSMLNISDMPQYAQNIYHQGKQIFTDFCQKKNIAYDEKDLDNIAMSLAAAGYANHMRGVSMINIKDDGQVLIGHKAPELRKAAVDMAQAAATPIEESISKVQETAQRFEYEEQQRQMAQSQSYGRGFS